jgi:hypothetical protein
MNARTWINFLTFQIAWFACVLGAAWGFPVAGTLTVIAAVTLHLAMSNAPRVELALLAVVTLIGTIWDSAIVSQGLMRYPTGTFATGIAPHWIIAMWTLFATTLNVSMAWLKGRPLLAAAFGAVGGPLAYFAGFRFGAVEIDDPALALGLQAAGWAVLMPLLTLIAARLDGVSDASAAEAARDEVNDRV